MLAAVSLVLLIPLARLLPHSDRGAHPLRDLFVRAGAPVAALALVAWMQDGNVIIVKHIATGRQAGSWAAAAVAAKAIMWIAVGLSLYIVPEVARRARLRERPAGVLTSALGLIAVVGIPMVLVYAVAGREILRIAFGHKFVSAAGALPWLGLAMCCLACTYLAVQYHLALHRWRFIGVLVVAAVAQPAVLVAIGADLTPIALGLLGVNAALAVTMVSLSYRARPGPVADEMADEPELEPVLTQTE